jgi:hypothetical protein
MPVLFPARTGAESAKPLAGLPFDSISRILSARSVAWLGLAFQPSMESTCLRFEALHRRLICFDEQAAEEIATLLAPVLRSQLWRRFLHEDPHVIESEIDDALMNSEAAEPSMSPSAIPPIPRRSARFVKRIVGPANHKIAIPTSARTTTASAGLARKTASARARSTARSSECDEVPYEECNDNQHCTGIFGQGWYCDQNENPHVCKPYTRP